MKPITSLRKFAKRGHRGFPLATIVFYGPDNRKATKVVLGVFQKEGDDPVLFKWYNEQKDARYDTTIQNDILARISEHGIASVAMSEGLFGCPHEEGIDYPEGGNCPLCPFWAGRNRFKHDEA